MREADRPLYELDVELLESLAPDVVVSQSLCDVCAVPSGDVVDAILSLPVKPRLIDLAPARLDDVPGCFAAVGEAISKVDAARELTDRWHEVFNKYRGRYAGSRLKVAFLDWLDPPFAASGLSCVDGLISKVDQFFQVDRIMGQGGNTDTDTQLQC